MVSFAVQKLFSFIYSHLFSFDFVAFAFGVKFNKSLPRPMSKELLPPMFPSRSFMVSGLCPFFFKANSLQFFKKIYLLFINFFFWLCWVFVSVRGLSLVAASGSHSSWRCAGLSLLRPLLLWSTGSRRAGSVVVAHGPSCSAACGIFPDPGWNLCPLHWQADSQPLRHQGSPLPIFNGVILLLFLLFSCRNSLYILDITPLSDI